MLYRYGLPSVNIQSDDDFEIKSKYHCLCLIYSSNLEFTGSVLFYEQT